MPAISQLSKSAAPERIPADVKAYLIGGGIAGLASAAYMIRSAKVPPANITIFENLQVTGGSMDAHGTAEQGYLMRGGRMFDKEAYTCLYDLASEVPSLRSPGQTVKDDILSFNVGIKTDAHARLIDEGAVKADATKLGISVVDNARFGELLVVPEAAIEGVRINSWFSKDFFTCHFWYMMRSTFAFQPWHSLIEFRRYCLRFMHEVPKLYNLGGVWRSPYNQYDSIIKPLEVHLRSLGVNFVFGVTVTDIEFEVTETERTAYRIHLTKDGAIQPPIELAKTDVVFATLGSLTSASTIGSKSAPPKALDAAAAQSDPAWALWKEIARKQPDFGRPTVFCGEPDLSKFESFSVTIRGDTTFFDRMVQWSGNEPGTGALVTFKDSPWGMSLVVPHQPHFANQPADCQVFWGYGLFPDAVGKFVKKPMAECSGDELLEEACHFLGFQADLPQILATSNTIPAMLPYTMAEFMVRKAGDRPPVVPKLATNFAFLGQFVEVPDDVVFTVEYSVRCAQIAVFHHFSVDREVTPIYKGWRDPAVLAGSIRAMLGI